MWLKQVKKTLLWLSRSNAGAIVTYGLAVYIIISDVLLFFDILMNGPDSLVKKDISIKKLMVGQMSFYIRTPLAYFLEDYFHISVNLPWLSANLISFTHVMLSLVSVKFLSSEALEWRQVGCIIFHVRNFLDSLDGVIYRAHAKQKTFKSNYGSVGYLVDAMSDTVGGVCLTVSVILFLLKKRPLVSSRQPSRARLLLDQLDQKYLPAESSVQPSGATRSGENGGGGGGYSLVLDLEDADDKKTNARAVSGLVYASRLYVIVCACFLGLRLALGAYFWDVSVQNFSDLLQGNTKFSNLTDTQKQMQAEYLSSSFTLLIMFSWRFVCAISHQDIILSAIFLDKIWEFISKTKYLWWLVLFGLVVVTEFDVYLISSNMSNAS